MFLFLNSSILALLGATVIPILIYLFVIKKPHKIVFSTLKHIKASQQRQKSKIKLKNILLLIIRCLIILLAILAISRPAIRTPLLHKYSRHSQAAIAIILDTSYSMEYLVDTRTELEIGKEIISEISNMLTERDYVVLLTSDRQWNRLYSTPYYGTFPEQLLASIEISYNPLPIGDLIEEATRKVKESHIINREIYVITDFRKQEYPTDNDIPVLLIPTSDNQERNNISVQDARIEEDFIQRQLERRISFEVVNHSDYNQQDILCQLIINGSTYAEKVTDLQPRQRKTESFNITISEPGWYSGYVSVRNERLPFDTRSYFTLYNPSQVEVAVITDRPDIPMALSSILNIYTKDNRNIHIISQDNINYDTFSQYRIVIIDTAKPLSARLRFIVERLANDNIGVLYLTSKTTDESWLPYFNQNFRLDLITYETQVTKRINHINQHHPIMAIISDDELDPIEISSFWNSRYRGSANILMQADNIPLVIENNREVIWLFDIYEPNNKFILDPIFPVMAYRTFLYCSYADTPDYQVGDRISLPNKRITLPNNEMLEINDNFYEFSQNGIYKLPVSSEEITHIPVNIDYTPSEYIRMALTETDAFTTLESDWQDNILRSRYGYEIWKILLALTVLLVATEMIIIKKEEKNEK